MTAIVLSCEVCGAPAGDDPHFPHDLECSGVFDPGCYCAALTCARCCWEDECQFSDLLLLDGSDEPVGMLPAGSPSSTAPPGPVPRPAASQHTTQPCPPSASPVR